MKIKYVVNFGTIFSGSILSFHSNLNQVGVTLTNVKLMGGQFYKAQMNWGLRLKIF